MYQLCLKPVVGLVLWWCNYDVFHLGSLLLVELGRNIVEFGSLACDGCQLKLRLSLNEPDGRLVGPEGWQAYSNSVHFWAGSPFSWLRHAEKSPICNEQSEGCAEN